MAKAINSNDIEQLSDMLFLSHENNYDQLTNDQLNMVVNTLKAPLKINRQNISLKDYLIKMKENSLLMIDDKKIILKSTNLLLSTNLPGVKFTFGEIQVWESNPSEFYTTFNPLPILPIQISCKVDDATYQNPETILFDPFTFNSNSRPIINVKYSERKLALSSSSNEALLFVNGKNAGHFIQKESKEYGPIMFNESTNELFVQKNLPWGVAQSSTKSIHIADQNNKHHFEIELINQNLIDDIKTTIQIFNNEYSMAFNYLEPSFLTVVSKNKIKYITKQIEENYLLKNRKIMLHLESYTIKEESFSIIEENGTYTIVVLVDEQYSEAKWHQSERMPAMKKNKPQRLRYILVYDDQNQRWLIDDWTIIA